VTERLVEAVHDFSALGDADFLGEAEDVTVRVIGEFEALVVTDTDTLGDLELLGDTVPDLVNKELPDIVTLPYGVTDGELVLLSDMRADSDAEILDDSRAVIDGEADTLEDS